MHEREERLRIDSVLASRGHIGMTLCPGKKQKEAASAGNRDLDEDLKVIADWGASSIVSLMEPHELVAFQVADLGERVEAFGLDWYHLPVKDVSVPDNGFQARWVYAGHRLRRALARGERILIHCRGGLGRTGMIAARLLVELGDTPEAAITKVRNTRSGTIETAAQAEYVEKWSAIQTSDDYADRVLGCLLGGAVGDALGYAVEFDRWPEIRDQYGPEGISELRLNDGVAWVSDDTQMTLFTLEGMLRGIRSGVSVIGEVGRAYRDWLLTQEGQSRGWVAAGALCEDRRLQHRQAPGNTCLSALRYGRPEANSKGCGGVMRVAPLGLVGRWSAKECFDYGAQAAAITHGHPTGYLSSGALTAIVRNLLDGSDLNSAVTASLQLLQEKPEHRATTDAIIAALAERKRTASMPAVDHLGEGWIAEEALAIGLHAALLSDSFPEVLRIAANHDGDSDSTASIAGQLFGACHGLADLPNLWIRRLDVLEPLLGLAGELIALH